jgi:hypothetical protein
VGEEKGRETSERRRANVEMVKKKIEEKYGGTENF